MTKTILFSLLVAFLHASPSCALDYSVKSRIPSWRIREYAKDEYRSTSVSTIVSFPRGGFNLAAATATATSAILGGNGFMLLIHPNGVSKDIYQKEPSKDDDGLSQIIMRAMGSMSVGMAITVYSSIVQQQPLMKGVGLGLLPRIGVMAWILAFRVRTTFLLINTLLASWCALNLIIGTSKASVTWKVFSCFSFLKGILLIVLPQKAMGKFLGVSKIGNESKALSIAFGTDVAASAVHMGSLAVGFNPGEAIAGALLFRLVFLADLAWRDQTWKSVEDSADRIYVQMVISALLGLGFLFSR